MPRCARSLPAGAAVGRGGTVRGLTAGEYEIVVTLLTPPGFEGTPPSLRVPLTVLSPAVASVEVTAEPGRLYQGTTLLHSATAHQADGSVRPQPVVSWSSSDPSVATVDRFGYVTATGTGAVTIQADVEGVAGSAAYDVAAFPAASLEINAGWRTRCAPVTCSTSPRWRAPRPVRWSRTSPSPGPTHGGARRRHHRAQRARADSRAGVSSRTCPACTRSWRTRARWRRARPSRPSPAAWCAR